jgi:hypothetical protein
VTVNVLCIDDILKSDAFAMDYFDNPAQRVKFQRWLNQLWSEKDLTLEKMSQRP